MVLGGLACFVSFRDFRVLKCLGFSELFGFENILFRVWGVSVWG